MEELDVQALIRNAIQEYVNLDQARSEPAYKAELQEERKRREQLERRMNELVEENKRSRLSRLGRSRSAIQQCGYLDHEESLC